jgi:hypothetical protein
VSFNNFIRQIWSDSILTALQKNLVYGALYNSDYQGEIAQKGDTVKISSIGDMTISDYVKDTDINPPESLTDAQTMLTISQAKYFNFEVDDVDQMQANPAAMSVALQRAGYLMADKMDQYYAGFYTDAIAANNIGSSGSPVTPVVATSANVGGGATVYDYLVVLNQYLTQKNVPKSGRWAVVPPWITVLLTQDIRFTSFNTDAARIAITTGKLDASAGNASDAYLGRIAGMDVYESNNAPHITGTVGIAGSVDVVMAGHSMGLTKAEGLNKTEAYRPPYRFADAVKGLALYGAKTVRPYAIASAYMQHP